MSESPQEPVAIVGMGVLLPGASTVERYWHNLVSGADAITEVPAQRRDPGFHDPAATLGNVLPDQTYCHRGGFVADTLEFDPGAHGVMPQSIETMEPDQLTALAVAAEAVADAGGLARLGDPARIGVILGRGGYLSPGLLRFDQRVRTVRQVTRTVREVLPSAGPEVLARLRTALLEPLGTFSPESTIGLVPNLAASRVANRLDFGGPAYTVDAACASSLVAVDQAVGELARRRCDVVLAGGVHHCHDDTLWSMFTQLGALSPSQRISPLSVAADGLLIGEGTAMVVLKRLADARRDGDRVYAVVRGAGTSSDGRGTSLVNPATGGQRLALRRAWAAAGLDPAEPGSIGLLEAHSTATKAGDVAELSTVAEVFGPPSGERAVIGSVKSMIGHTLPTAGVAGLIKAALALYHHTLLPTLNCEDPNPLLAGTRFRTLTEAAPWERGTRPRRAGVNAFGFGGVNAHVVLEEHDRPPSPKRASTVVTETEQALRLAANSPEELLRLLDRPETSTPDSTGRFRLGIVGPDEQRLAMARKIVAKGEPWQGLKDVWFTPDPLLRVPTAKTAFVFPGLEADAAPRCSDVARHFGLDVPDWSTASVLDRATSVSGVGRLLYTALSRLGLVPDGLAGHSVGEWTAMQAAGMYPAVSTQDLLDRYWPDGFTLPEVDFLVLGCSAERTAEFLESEPEVLVSHENAPRQTIVCGPPESIGRLSGACRAQGVVARVLPFRSGFHTPFLAPHVQPFVRLAEGLRLHAPRIPVWSATTARPYPADVAAVRDLYIAHLVEPVRFRKLLEAMYEDGFRVFIQAGAGQLGSFVSDTFGDRKHLVLGAASSARDGLAQLRRVATALWVEGARPRFDALEPHRIRLSTGGSLLSVSDSARGMLEPSEVSEPVADLPDGVPDEIMAEFSALLRETREASTVVVAATKSRTVESVVESIVDVSVEAMPYLRDHRFFRQPEDWPDEVDRRPVVPATTLVDLACREAVRAWPGVVAIAVHDAVFSRWLTAAPACRVPVTMTRDGNRVTVEIGPYAAMTVELASAYPEPSHPPTRVFAPETSPPLTASEIYSRREMFHGPEFQGLAELTGIGEQHIRGDLVIPSAPGALLDNVGQLLGCWLMGTQTTGLLAFPRSMGRIRFHGPELPVGTRLSCLVRIRTPEPDLLEMDAELVHNGRVWAEVTRWQDIRFPCDRPAHRVYAFPDRHRLAEEQDGGWSLVTDHWPTVAARDIYAGVYLNADEREEFAACAPRRQRGWLLERIAVKDAIRARLGKPVYPAEIHVRDNKVSGRHGRDLPALDVAVAHLDGLAVALVRDPAQEPPPRIAIRREGELTGLLAEVAGPRADPVLSAELPGYVVAWTAEQS